MTPQISIEAQFSKADRKHIVDRLIAFNRDAVGWVSYEPVSVSLREAGELRGAILGRTNWNWLYVDEFWVDPTFRRRGYGTVLLVKAEDEARRRGCTQAFLDTFSFQAPGFYKKNGYREFARLPDFPKGHARIWVTKAL